MGGLQATHPGSRGAESGHVPDDAAALREMHRILRPGGALVVFSPNRLFPCETHGVFARRSSRRVSNATPFIPWIGVSQWILATRTEPGA